MHFIARIAGLVLALALPAQAQETKQEAPVNQDKPERIEIDTNLFCDTQQQVERFVTLLDENGGSAETAIEQVNAENKTQDACVIATAAYRRAGVAGAVRNSETTFDVTRIVVIGVYTVNGLERSLPTEFFTLLPRSESGTVGQRPQ
jgi:phosphotransacetylase